MEPAQAERTLNKIPSRVEDVAMDTRTKLNEYVRYADRQVHSNPWTAVGIGFGAGMVFGALLAMAVGSQRSSGILNRF